MNPRDEPIFDGREIALALADHGVDFVVVGGVAVQAHGHIRSTRDLDVIPRPDILNLSRLGEALAALEARLLRSDAPIDAGDPHVLRGAPMVPLQTAHGRLDVLNIASMTGAPPSYEDLRDRAVETDIDGRVIAVAGVDDLIRMKRVAGRDVDLEDIGALTRTDEQLQDEAGEST